MRSRVPWCTILIALLACRHGSETRPENPQPTEDRVEEVEAVSYRGPAVPSIMLAPGTFTGAVVGTVYGCDGWPLPAVHLNARHSTSDTASLLDTLLQLPDSTFVLDSLMPGDWQLSFRLIGYQPRSIPMSIQSGRVDTLMVQLTQSRLRPIGDCVCADGRGFGSQCCKPITIRVCTPRDAKIVGQ